MNRPLLLVRLPPVEYMAHKPRVVQLQPKPSLLRCTLSRRKVGTTVLHKGSQGAFFGVLLPLRQSVQRFLIGFVLGLLHDGNRELNASLYCTSLLLDLPIPLLADARLGHSLAPLRNQCWVRHPPV